MKSLYLDATAGISGDMTVGALLDLGVPLEYLEAELALLNLPVGSYVLACQRTERQHVGALKFNVAVHDHHTHRHYADIEGMIGASGLSAGVKATAQKIFRRLAEAEALAHGVPVEEVHFHEVGAVDSIVDIVGTAICLEYLRIDQVYVSPLPLGSGFVETAHGRLPVPAPATAELLKGLAVHGRCGEGERVTPTGAAIAAALATSVRTLPEMTIRAIGAGAGAKDFADCPNVLRAMLGEGVEETGQVMVMETNIDDSTAEILGYAMERLFDGGALDVFFTPIQMKKNRPATKLSVICQREQLDTLSRVVMQETTAIGVRYYPVSRLTLERRQVERQTSLGQVVCKETILPKGTVRTAPEYDACRIIARETGHPCQDIMAIVTEEAGLAAQVGRLLRERQMTLSLAESCTGGLIAAALTDVPGSSDYFLESAVTYSNGAKMRMLGVPAELLDQYGAVSAPCAEAMAIGMRQRSESDLAIAVTGIAGPGGGTPDKPVGTVFIALARAEGCQVERHQFQGDRTGIRNLTTGRVLEMLCVDLEQ